MIDDCPSCGEGLPLAVPDSPVPSLAHEPASQWRAGSRGDGPFGANRGG